MVRFRVTERFRGNHSYQRLCSCDGGRLCSSKRVRLRSCDGVRLCSCDVRLCSSDRVRLCRCDGGRLCSST